jgi:hypothetical protein
MEGVFEHLIFGVRRKEEARKEKNQLTGLILFLVSFLNILAVRLKTKKTRNPIGFFPNGSEGNRAILKKQRAGSSKEARCIARRS